MKFPINIGKIKKSLGVGGPKPKPKPKSKPKSKAKLKPKPKVKLKIKPKLKPLPKPKIKLKTKFKPKPRPKLKQKPKPKLKPKFKPKPKPKFKVKSKGKVKELEKYSIQADGINAKVVIQKLSNVEEQGSILVYKLILPELSKITEALLDEIRRELVAEVTLTTQEILDPKSVSTLKEKFKEKAILQLERKLHGIKGQTKKFLVGRLVQEMLGLDKIEFLLADTALEEIVITSALEPVRVYHKKHAWLSTNIIPKSEEEIQNYSNIIARRVGRQITTLNPLLDAHLVTGDRANAVLYPISTKGNTITIRMFRREPWTVVDLIENKTCSAEIFSLLWLAMEYEMNILFSGGTASGKTTFLNVCMPFLPPNHRIISIEDTRELQLPKFLYWCPLITRLPNPEGKGAVTMLDLLINSLRMRPDRIILGEMRRQKEAEVLFEAMHTGHSVYATVHADSAAETISRLVNPPLNVPPNLLNEVHLCVVMFRDRRKGVRRILQVSEFIGEEDEIKTNIVYRYKPTTDSIVPHSRSIKFFEQVARHTGFSQREISESLATKRKIFKWLLKKNLRSLNEVGSVMNHYYTNREKLLKVVRQNKSFSAL